MAGRGPAPKPSHLRQRVNRKAGAAVIEAPLKPKIPAIPNPDKRKWHPLTTGWWKRVWSSAMASQFLPTDVDGLGRLAVLIDTYNQKSAALLLAEIRLQEARFGLSPLDRSRLQWEVATEPYAPSVIHQAPRRSGGDPRGILTGVK